MCRNRPFRARVTAVGSGDSPDRSRPPPMRRRGGEHVSHSARFSGFDGRSQSRATDPTGGGGSPGPRRCAGGLRRVLPRRRPTPAGTAVGPGAGGWGLADEVGREETAYAASPQSEIVARGRRRGLSIGPARQDTLGVGRPAGGRDPTLDGAGAGDRSGRRTSTPGSAGQSARCCRWRARAPTTARDPRGARRSARGRRRIKPRLKGRRCRTSAAPSEAPTPPPSSPSCHTARATRAWHVRPAPSARRPSPACGPGGGW